MFQGSSQLRSSKLYNHGSSARVKRSCLGLGVFQGLGFGWDVGFRFGPESLGCWGSILALRAWVGNLWLVIVSNRFAG